MAAPTLIPLQTDPRGVLAAVNTLINVLNPLLISLEAGGGGGGGSGITRSISSVAVNTAAGAAALTDYIYFVSAAAVLTLPTAVGNTNNYTVSNIDGSAVTVATTGGQTIQGAAAPVALGVQYSAMTLISDGANWQISA